MISAASPTLDLSVVVPVHNESASVETLLTELVSALQSTGRTWEIVMVDDGSQDGSDRMIAEAARRDPQVRAVLLAPRSGQSAAIAAGLWRATGRILVTIDADLQNDPADLPRVLAALEHADVVSGIRVTRHDSTDRKLASRIANGIRRVVLGDTVTDMGCSFKAYRREALVGLPVFVGVHRFLPALCQFRGATLVEVPVSHRPRRFGVSKYGIGNRLWRGLRDVAGVHWLKSRLIATGFHEKPRSEDEAGPGVIEHRRSFVSK